MSRYRKKPVVIDAHVWDGDWNALRAWIDSLGFQPHRGIVAVLWSSSPSCGRRTPDPDIFAETYEEVSDAD